jgi:hypothetical protein
MFLEINFIYIIYIHKMTNSDVDTMKMMGGKRKNGHKMDCGCHICKNMEAKAERHGYQEDIEKDQERKMGGPQKKNGHKKDCGCPICCNMKDAKSGSKKVSKGASSGKKSNGHKMDCGCPICGNMKKKKGGDNKNPENNDTENKELVGKVERATEKEENELLKAMKSNNELPVGGSKKTKRSNGHKPGCGCPICNNMKKKTRRQKKKRNSKRRN